MKKILLILIITIIIIMHMFSDEISANRLECNLVSMSHGTL